jgi:hypothetical protein
MLRPSTAEGRQFSDLLRWAFEPQVPVICIEPSWLNLWQIEPVRGRALYEPESLEHAKAWVSRQPAGTVFRLVLWAGPGALSEGGPTVPLLAFVLRPAPDRPGGVTCKIIHCAALKGEDK